METSGKVVGGIVTNDRLAFVGNEKGAFMAIKLETGELEWKIETSGNIQSTPLLFDDLVFFESANIFYVLKQDTGKEVWNYRLNIPAEKYMDAGKEYLYKISKIKIVDRTEVSIQNPTTEPILTMYTCHPIYSEKQRLVVIGDLVD